MTMTKVVFDSVRTSTRREFFGANALKADLLPHVRIHSPSSPSVSGNPVLSSILERAQGELRRVPTLVTYASSVGSAKNSVNEIADNHWLSCVPTSLLLRGGTECIVNYLTAVVAIDFRHWAEVRDGCDSADGEAAAGEIVSHFGGFYAMVTTSDATGANLVHAEKVLGKQGTTAAVAAPAVAGRLLRGSAAMIYLLKRAVDEHDVHWYDKHYLSRFTTVEEALDGLQVCFLGCKEDGVTPLWMPAMRQRVELLLSFASIERNSFFSVLRDCGGRLFSDKTAAPEVKLGFIEQLVQLHPRYHDFVPDFSHEDRMASSVQVPPPWFPILKLSQLTALALQHALPTYWRWRWHQRNGEDKDHSVEEMKTSEWLHKAAERARDNSSSPFMNLFADAEELSICCDYQIPRALRAAGLLVYDDYLADLVDRAVLLAPGSVEEVSIRVATLIAVEHLHDYVETERARASETPEAPVNSARVMGVLDYALWYVGRYLVGSEMHHHHHLCKTIMY